MESVLKARQRLRRYPEILVECSAPAAAYATCVLAKENVKQLECEREFQEFRHCLQKAAHRMGTRLCIRLALIAYGEVHDMLSAVQYTDIDYRVFTDAARHMLSGASPYERHTYRYSPLLAAVLIPNLVLHPAWGKLLFSLVDICVALLIRCLALAQGSSPQTAVWCALVWIYNPLAIVIATRGNADSISAMLVLLTLLLLEKRYILLAGIVHGLAIHVRLYPIAFSLAMYLSLNKDCHSLHCKKVTSSETENTTMKKLFTELYPSWKHVKLVLGCVITLALLTCSFYAVYGYTFLQESLLYHLSRRDIRHNFSIYFYLQYLGSSLPIGLLQRLFTFAPQVILILALSWAYGSRQDLPFCLLSQAVVMVAYNPVLTAQYFVWFLSLVPPCLPWLSLSYHQATAIAALWLAAQLAWLLPAYWLEFRGQDTFVYIWLQSIALFCANVAVLARLIRAYHPVEEKKVK
ncbi:GPI mannosyltransferase 1 [Blattella germanica]|nr:GPI mannosyltransferase 1 [Blattella germanica]